jgi:arsenite methyltransferase
MPLDAHALRLEIRKVYSQIASDPKKGYHFPTGADYAAERLGYRREELAELPATITPSFASLGNPLAMGLPLPGDTVVDIGAVRATRIPSSPPVTWGPRASCSPWT